MVDVSRAAFGCAKIETPNETWSLHHDESRHRDRNVRAVADQFAEDRADRQLRRELDSADFDQLTAAGLHLTGSWPNTAVSGKVWRAHAAHLRPAAHSGFRRSWVALVCSMHSGGARLWLATPR